MTSAAAPMVSGALSNILSIFPQLSPEQQKVILTKTAQKIPASKERPLRNGAGLLNACLMLE